jgi:hypothetical protein
VASTLSRPKIWITPASVERCVAIRPRLFLFCISFFIGGIDGQFGTSSLLTIQLSQTTAARVLLAAVVDTRNRPVVDVGADDFVITEGGQPRDVLDVHVADYPVVVLIDDGPEQGATPVLAPMKAAVVRFISRIGQRPVAVGTLSRPEPLVATFDDKRAEVFARVERLAVTPSDAAPLQAVAQAAQLLQETGAPFSAIVIVTSRAVEGADSLSAERLPFILESGATIHVVAGRLRHTEDRSPAAPDMLRGLADQTLGQYTGIFATASYAIALDRLADRMATELMIEYLVPPGPPAGDVRVGARVAGARVIGLGVSK